MLTKFWEGVGGKLAEGWAAAAVTPAFGFWAGGLGLWLWSDQSRLTRWEKWVQDRPSSIRVGLLVTALLTLWASAIIVKRFDISVLRLLEGYWRGPIAGKARAILVEHMTRKRTAWSEEYQPLAAKGPAGLDAKQRDRYVTLDLRLMRIPADPANLMPTRLGNLLRAAEGKPLERYGLDAIVCWPRLWLVLPDGTKQELATARKDLDSSVVAWMWAVLFLAWTPLIWWAAPIAVGSAFIAYSGALKSAAVYGELFQAAFDVHRGQLFEALRWPRPTTPAEEAPVGERVTEYLWRGLDGDDPQFEAASEDAK